MKTIFFFFLAFSCFPRGFFIIFTLNLFFEFSFSLHTFKSFSFVFIIQLSDNKKKFHPVLLSDSHFLLHFSGFSLFSFFSFFYRRAPPNLFRNIFCLTFEAFFSLVFCFEIVRKTFKMIFDFSDDFLFFQINIQSTSISSKFFIQFICIYWKSFTFLAEMLAVKFSQRFSSS